MNERSIWNRAAQKLGWEWSPAHNGFIKNSHRTPGARLDTWESYPSDMDAEDACFIDGVETLSQAAAVVEAEPA